MLPGQQGLPVAPQAAQVLVAEEQKSPLLQPPLAQQIEPSAPQGKQLPLEQTVPAGQVLAPHVLRPVAQTSAPPEGTHMSLGQQRPLPQQIVPDEQIAPGQQGWPPPPHATQLPPLQMPSPPLAGVQVKPV